MTAWSDSILSDAGMLRALLEGLQEALIVSDTDGVIRYWNPAAERIFGHAREEALGQSLNLLIPERFRPAHDAGFARAVASGRLRTGTRVRRTRSHHPDGRPLYRDVTVARRKNPARGGVGVDAHARDATEAHLQQQKQQAVQAGAA